VEVVAILGGCSRSIIERDVDHLLVELLAVELEGQSKERYFMEAQRRVDAVRRAVVVVVVVVLLRHGVLGKGAHGAIVVVHECRAEGDGLAQQRKPGSDEIVPVLFGAALFLDELATREGAVRQHRRDTSGTVLTRFRGDPTLAEEGWCLAGDRRSDIVAFLQLLGLDGESAAAGGTAYDPLLAATVAGGFLVLAFRGGDGFHFVVPGLGLEDWDVVGA